ncbi:MAG: hypothetical protein EAZ57_01105 [Cytophagales bacterium]|nr:MAG: hypothetical protein EAZ67_02170 [Cytophagales bacterium]TAF62048.1 MAG: hypothetical protein EAZ57_01105 [Cytophagales bacterium]
MQPKILDAESLKDWIKHKGTNAALQFILPFVEGKSRALIENVEAEVKLLLLDEVFMPLVFGNEAFQERNSFVCSPMAHYVHYAKIELDVEMADKTLLIAFAKPFLNLLGNLGRFCQFEKVVYINNWLLTTNLYPTLTAEDYEKIKCFLLKQYPDRALVFRSVNVLLNQSVFESLLSLGFKPVLSRQVYITDVRDGNFRQNSNYKKDLKLKRKLSFYEWEDLKSPVSAEDLTRIHTLYRKLYIAKYSVYNPDLSPEYILNSLKSGFLSCHILRNRQESNRIDAVIGYYAREGVMTTPFAGYDLEQPKAYGLYRLLTLKITEESEKQKLILNRSSGASGYKRLRGAKPVMEYNMVFDQHLSWRRRLIWRVFRGLSKYIVIPIMQKMGL